MHKYLLALLLVAGLDPAAAAQTTDEQVEAGWRTPGTDSLDAKNGFRAYRFGIPVSSLPGLKLIETAADSKYYQLPGDKLQIGAGRLTKIAYGFYKGRLGSVIIDLQGENNADAVLEALEAQYGKGRTSGSAGSESYYWYGRRVQLTFSRNAKTHHASLFLISNEITEQQKQDRLKKAASDL